MTDIDHDYRARLVTDARVSGERFVAEAPACSALAPRPTMRAITSLVALAIADPGAHDAERRAAATAYAGHLATLQGDGGLFSSSGNLASPPDTSFSINDLCLAVELLHRYRPDGFDEVEAQLLDIARRATPALAAGGVHTPNHRWELASALGALAAHVHADDPAVRAVLVDRVDVWLAEGIDIDDDGQYSERSGIYAAEVTNPSLIALAADLDRPGLLDHVRRNLHALVDLVEDDGEVENVHSRRQDQKSVYDVEQYLSPLRRFAIADDDGDLARVARQILGRGLREPERHLAELLRSPELAGVLPTSTPRAASSTRLFATSRLLRRREGDLSVSIFAGSDYPSTGRIGSGLANSATLVRARQGGLVLRSLRVSPAFFSTGSLRPQRLDPSAGGAVLIETRSSGYYDALAGRPLSMTSAPDDEGRFFAVMRFADRERFEMTLESRVRVDVSGDGVDVELSFSGTATRYAVELVLDGEVEVEGARTSDDGWWLDGDHAVVRDGAMALTIETESGDGVPPVFDDGEQFSYVGGDDRIPGTRILLGGSTTAKRRLRLRFSESVPESVPESAPESGR